MPERRLSSPASARCSPARRCRHSSQRERLSRRLADRRRARRGRRHRRHRPLRRHGSSARPADARIRLEGDDYDLLSAGGLAGHIVECGPQATGGIFTDWGTCPTGTTWASRSPNAAPTAVSVTKPDGPAGSSARPPSASRSSTRSATRGLRYARRRLRLADVKLEQIGRDRVASRREGPAPTSTYKVTATYSDGYRCCRHRCSAGATRPQGEGGRQGDPGAFRRLMREAGFGDFAESRWRSSAPRRATARGAGPSGARGGAEDRRAPPKKEALEIFALEIYPAATAMAQG